ncbi:MAG: transposase, partial [Candidatus Methanomethylophilaceae archaeon]|nr:transposase [Candidatus Methanomethylophilaceae archaeon]
MTVSMRSATYRLYPRREQERKMIRFLNGTRRVYNHLVHVCRNCISLGVSIPTEFELMGMATRMRQEEPDLQDIHSHCFASVAKRVHNAFMGWMKRHKDGVGFPRFRSYNMFDSFTYTQNTDYAFVGKNGEKDRRERVRLGMIGLVKFSNPFVIDGECKTATVYRKRIGNHYEWFVTIAYAVEDLMKDTEFMDPLMAKRDVGLDLGLENLVTMSDGTVIPNDRTYRKKERELA